MVRKLYTSIKKVDKIFHLADIHIRNFKRHKEYREVFERTYEYIAKNKTENSITYIGGDLVHSKTDISPELIKLLSEFLNNLANLCPTLVILGNHDTNLNNKSRIDALTPIVELIQNENLHFLDENGYYKFAQLGINVLEVSTDPSEFLPIHGIKDEEIKIAFFHGAVDGAKTDLNIQLKNDRVTVKTFKDYDLALLGDIHKRQFVSTEPYIAYPSSLIQQNHGESLAGHGLLEWDLSSMTAKEVNIPNDYGYVTLNVEDGEILNWDESFPQKLRVRLRFKNTSLDQKKLIQAMIRHNRTVVEMTIQSETVSTSSQNDEFTIQDVRDVGYQNELLEQYFENDEDALKKIDAIRSVNREVNSKVNTDLKVKNTVWKPLKFEFSNMFSYGEDNVIDFTNMAGTYGIFAPNATGKSSIFDALSFCLYDKCSRTAKASEVLNQEKDQFYCVLQYAIQDQIYYIEKTGKKYGKEGKVKVDIDFYTFDSKGEKVSLNGEQRDATNKIIRNYIGTYEDFILTALSLQNNSSNFIEKSQKERRELLSDFLDINVFEELNAIATEEIKETRAVVKSLMNKDIESSIAEKIQELEEVTAKIEVVKDDISKGEAVLDEQIKEKEKLIGQLRETRDLPNEQETKLEIEKYKEKLEKEKIEEKNVKSSISLHNSKLKELKEQDLKDKDSLISLQNQLKNTRQEAKDKEQEARAVITSHTTLIEDAKISIEHLKEHEYDPNCEYCVKNNIVVEGEKAKKRLKTLIEEIQIAEKAIKEATGRIKETTEMLERLEKEFKKLSEIELVEQQIVQLGLKEEAITSKIEVTKNKISQLQDTLQQIEEARETLIHNNTVKDQIKKAEEEINDTKQSIKVENHKLNTYQQISVKTKTIIEGFEDDLNKLKELNDKYEAYELYIKAVRSSGIPYMIVQKALPTLEREVNRLLHQIVDFEVRFESDGKNIDANITYQGESVWPLELTSGMEKFITSLGIRTALIRNTTLPKPNFLCIDEGFGVLDSEHLAGMNALFDLLKSEFDIVLCISHLDTMKDVVDKRIEVDKNEEFSYLNYR